MFCPKCSNSAGRRRDFIERTLRRLAGTLEFAAAANNSATSTGLLQQLDPRVKIGGLLLLIVAAVTAPRVGVIAGIFGAGLLLAILSGSGIVRRLAKLWLGILVFSGTIVLPALFTTPGPALWHLPGISWPVTVPGLHSAIMLIARSETAATLATVMVLTTRWPHLLKALRVFRVPVVFVVILGMTQRYIFLLVQIAEDFFEAHRARQVGRLSSAQRRHMAGSTAAVLLSKSMQLSSEVYDAMQARGFRGTVYTLDEFRMKPLDWGMLGVFVSLSATAFWMGRQ